MGGLTHWSPIVLPLIAGIVVLALDAWSRRRAALVAAVAGLAAGSVASFLLAFAEVPKPAAPSLASVFRFGGEASGLVAVLLAVAALTVAGGWRRGVASGNGGLAAGLVCLSSAGVAAVVEARALITLVLAFETVAIAAYGLVGAAGTGRSREAAMKYVVQGAIVTALAVLALAVGLAVEPDFVMATLGSRAAAASGTASAVLLCLILAVVAFKSGAFPFHSWAPDAYEASDAPAAAYMASVPKSAALFAGAIAVASWSGKGALAAVAALAVASIAFGNIAGLAQTSYRRMLAYSGIAHAGYALGVLVAGPASVAMAVYAAVYSLGVAGAFLVEEAILETHPAWDGTIAGMRGLWRRRPALAVSALVLLLSLTGIPLTAGFWGKLVVFATLVSGGWTWLAVVGVIGSVVSFGYYGSTLRVMFLAEEREGDDTAAAGRPGAATVATAACAVAVLVVGCAPFLFGMHAVLRMLGV